jgi:hypothetical protein
LSAPLRLYAKYFSTPRARNDYATHVPVLIGLAKIIEIKSVLEFGCGYYSTRTFLNRRAFPHLERLISIENDAAWAESIQSSVNEDRFVLKQVMGEIADSVKHLDLEAFDLILIDDSKTSAQRASTIRAIAAKQTQSPWIVIHDFEVEEYRTAAAGFKQRHSFKAYNPHTGVVSNKPFDFKLLDQRVKQNCKTLEPDDLEGWLKVLNPA